MKLGRASEAAREAAIEGGVQGASDTLLADYSVTPNVTGRTPRTPAPVTDRILQVSDELNNFCKILLNVLFTFQSNVLFHREYTRMSFYMHRFLYSFQTIYCNLLMFK